MNSLEFYTTVAHSLSTAFLCHRRVSMNAKAAPAHASYSPVSTLYSSLTVLTPITWIPSGLPAVFRQLAGMMTLSNPSFLASCRRTFAWLTERTSPLRPTSPNTIVFSSITISLKLDMSAATIPRSTAGSRRRMPPAILTYASQDDSISAMSAMKDMMVLFMDDLMNIFP